MPFNKGKSGNPGGRPKGSRNKVKVEIQEAARQIVESPTYLASLKRRLRQGKAPHMEPILFYYAYGKPLERITPVNPDGLTAYSPGGMPYEERVRRIMEMITWLKTRNGNHVPVS